MDPLVVVFGLGVGVLIGVTGIGGGSLMTPLLILVIGINPVVAIGTDLAYGAVTKTVGGWRHLRKGTVDLGVSKWLAFGSVPGALVGVWVVERAGASGDLLPWIAAMLFVVAFTLLTRAMFLRGLAERERHRVRLTSRTKTMAITVGGVLGFVLGLTSVGSGALIGVALILMFRLTPHRVVGTDVFHAAILLWAAAVAHGVAGNIDYELAATILLGSLPGVWLGSELVTRVPVDALRTVLGCVLLGSALGVLKKSGVDVAPALVVGIPLAVGALVFMVHRVRGPVAAPGGVVV
jgi:uncharacterized membrane protein YfcA